MATLLELVDAAVWTPRYAATTGSLLRGLAQSLASSMPWVLVDVAVLWLTFRFPIQRSGLVVSLLVHLAAFPVAMAALAGRTVVMNDLMAWSPSPIDFQAKFTDYLLGNLTVYLTWLGTAHAARYYALHQERQAQLAHAQQELTRAELAALRSQIQPHFLFNALNAIVALVHENPMRAEQMIIRLSTLLRRSLDSDHAQEVPLGTDLQTLRAYLEIETVRFEDRLSVRWDIDPMVLNALIPPLLLQPLAENAIRHGLMPRLAPGEVCISARPHQDRLHLSVCDNGVGMPAQPSAGIGLANVRARLTHLYGSAHTFEVLPRHEGGVMVTIHLPLRMEAL